MPLTIAHTAAALPFRKFCPRFLNFPALVAGTMAPDLAYPFHLFQLSAQAHSFTLDFLLNLPAGICLLVVYNLSKNAIASQLPSPHREYWTAPVGNNVQYIKSLFAPWAILSLSFSILLGAATHIAWDSFTHLHGLAVDTIPFLSSELINFGQIDLKVYKFLQYFSSAVGLAIVWFFYKELLKEQPEKGLAHQYKKFWFLVGLSGTLGILLTISQALTEPGQKLAHVVFLAIVNVMVMLPLTFLTAGVAATVVKPKTGVQP